MRAKMRVLGVHEYKNDAGKIYQEDLSFGAVSRSEAYPEDGSDEDNTFARWTPNAHLSMSVMNPALFGEHKVGDVFYVDFTRAS